MLKFFVFLFQKVALLCSSQPLLITFKEQCDILLSCLWNGLVCLLVWCVEILFKSQIAQSHQNFHAASSLQEKSKTQILKWQIATTCPSIASISSLRIILDEVKHLAHATKCHFRKRRCNNFVAIVKMVHGRNDTTESLMAMTWKQD